MVISLLDNVARLLAMSILYSFLMRFWKRETVIRQMLAGVLFGGVAVLGMASPFVLQPGLVFDGRTILAAIAGAFCGPAAAIVVVIMGSVYRLWMGGVGTVVGVGTLASAAILGVAFYYLRRRYSQLTALPYHLLLGIVVHVVMVLWMFMLPEDIAWKTVKQIAAPVLLVFPLATALLSVLIQDITQRRQAETERDRLFNSSIDMLCIAGFDGYFKQVNPAFTQSLGWTARELRRQPWLDFVHPDDHDETVATLKTLSEGKSILDFQNRYRTKDGSYRLLSWNSFPQPEQRLILAVARDATEKVAMEQQLRQAQKIEAIGKLAGGVAHDLNNMLTPILGYAELMARSPSLDETTRDYLSEMRSAAESARDITGQLLAFGRKQVLQVKPVNLNDVIEGAKTMLSRLIREDLDVRFKLADDLGTVRADPSQIEQILMNLVLNASQAMPNGGILSIETGNVELDESYLHSHPGSTVGPNVMLAVTDTGCGMAAGTLAHIFEPFFTTKEDKHGTGLGLATVYGIVKQHGGSIWVYSELQKGTAIKVFLPQVSDKSEKPPAPAAKPTGGGTETILLVEDDAAVRKMTKTLLDGRGYRVLAAGSPDEALKIVAGLDSQIHLLLTDVILPGMNGAELSRRLTEVLPEIRTIFMSGYTDNVIEHHGVLDPGVHFVQKPFSAEHLAVTVRTVLDE